MTLPQPTPADLDCQDPFRWTRSAATDLLEQARLCPPTSRRAFAAAHDVPASTLLYWQRRRDRLDAPAALRDFFESPAGLDFLHRLVLAAHLDFQQSGCCGIRTLLAFFRHAGLAPFLACSYGSHQRLARRLQDLLIDYGQQQRQALAPNMPPGNITLCEDENFHQGQPCLVAIEPVANFLLVETVSAQRDAASWNRAVAAALEGLPLSVVQVTSDEARGLLAHAKDGLGAHHSPDLMHLQQELHRATALPLRRHVEQARHREQHAELQAFQLCVARIRWQDKPPRPGRPPDFELYIRLAKEHWHETQQDLVDSQQRQEQARQAIRGLGDDYHPFDAASGAAVTPEELGQRLHGRLELLEQAARAAELGEGSVQKIQRVRRLLPQLVATLAWFWLQVRQLSQTGEWPAEQGELLRGPLLSWQYWEQASRRGRDAKQRGQLRELAGRCRQQVEDSPVWQALSEPDRARLKEVARQCAGRWVRSSSCVEGRNGVLRLRHHGRRGLTGKGLAALTVLHNYAVKRPDGTTAAQRFFGQPPEDLFDWLRQRFPELPRPAQPRRKMAA